MGIDWQRVVPHAAHSVEAASPPQTHVERLQASDAIRAHLTSCHGWEGKSLEYAKLLHAHARIHEQMNQRQEAQRCRDARKLATERAVEKERGSIEEKKRRAVEQKKQRAIEEKKRRGVEEKKQGSIEERKRRRAAEVAKANRQRRRAAGVLKRARRLPVERESEPRAIYASPRRADPPTVYTYIRILRGGGVESSRRRH